MMCNYIQSASDIKRWINYVSLLSCCCPGFEEKCCPLGACLHDCCQNEFIPDPQKAIVLRFLLERGGHASISGHTIFGVMCRRERLGGKMASQRQLLLPASRQSPRGAGPWFPVPSNHGPRSRSRRTQRLDRPMLPPTLTLQERSVPCAAHGQSLVCICLLVLVQR